MGIIQTASPAPWKGPVLVNPVMTTRTNTTFVSPRDMSADRMTLYGTVGTKLQKSVDDGTTWTDVFSFPSTAVGFWRLPNGEAIVSVNPGGGGGGYLMTSTGFGDGATDTAATWAQATGLLGSKPSSYVHGYWGLSFAPKGHPREGLVVAAEYGPQSAAGDAAGVLGKAWVSTDYGRTWAQIFTVASVAPANNVGQHVHGIAYDPFDDAVLVSFGDGNTGTGAKAGVMVSYNFLAASPTWAWVVGPATSADFQLTGIRPLADGVLFGGDGAPPGIYRLPRRGYRQYGQIQTVLNFGGGTDTGFIGQSMYQFGEGYPMFIGYEFNKNPMGSAPVIIVTDGRRFSEAYRKSDNKLTAQYPATLAVGPTARGRVFAYVKEMVGGTTTHAHMVADYVGIE